MLIRKSLYGNLRPNPGDLYDPRDGSCLPNFHLSTSHNPNLPHITQDLVKYDIQLVREMSSKPVNPHHPQRPNNDSKQSNNSLMLLAVAEYSEGLEASRAPSEQPFVIHKVFYREAVAGMLHLKHNIADRDIAMLQSILRQCIPNPENFKSKLLQQFNVTISKVSIIQHGQEYHYTNIKMAFIEVSKIINQVCSLTNLNARSILVEIPSVLPYSILDRNRYLAYLHEKQKREREEERRRMELHLRYQQSLTHSHITETNQYPDLYDDRTLGLNLHPPLDQHHSISTQASYSDGYYGRNTVDQACQTPLDLGMSSRAIDLTNYAGIQYSGQFVKFPIETSIRTRQGKKIVTYHDTGEIIECDNHSEYQSQSWLNFGHTGLAKGTSLGSSSHFSKSTPNLAKDMDATTGHDRSFGSDQDVSFDEHSEIPSISYLRARSQSVGDVRFKDKTDRYPALLIEPGRKSIRGHDFSDKSKNKWRTKSPKFWSGSDSLTRANIPNAHAQGNHQTQKTTSLNKSTLGTTEQGSVVNTHNRGAVPSIQVQHSSTGPYLNEPTSHGTQGRRLSLVSNFSDISVSSRLQQDADVQFKEYLNTQQVDRQPQNGQPGSHRSSQINKSMGPPPLQPKKQGGYPSSLSAHLGGHPSSRTNKNESPPPPLPPRKQGGHPSSQSTHQGNQSLLQPNREGGQPVPSTSQAVNGRPVNPKYAPLHPSYFTAAAEFLKQSGDYYSDDTSINSGQRVKMSQGKVGSGDDSDTSSLLLEQTPSGTPDPSSGSRTHTVDRDFVYKAYPVRVREA